MQFLERPANGNGNGAPASNGEAMPAAEAGSADPESGVDRIPF